MKLIDKDALVAELERRREESWLGHYTKEKGIVFDITDDILSFIDTLEVKEADLEKEYEEFVVDDPILGNFITNDTMGTVLAKHFFELGLSINRRDTNMPVIDSMLIEKGIDPYSKEAKLFKERCFAAIDAAIEIFKTQKGNRYDRQSTKNP